MTYKEKRELKDGVVSIFKRFNILYHTSTIGNLRDDILRYIDSMPEEPVSEGLGEYIFELSKQFPEVSFAKLSRIAVRVAKWQKEQMMSKAIDALVHTFDNGYIRVGTQLLENNKYGLKVGDKVKVIIIKDE